MMSDEDQLKLHRDLLIACGWGKEIDVILLLQQGASVRVQDQDGRNCLHYSSCKGHIQVTNLLLEKGCAINAVDKGKRTPLHLAAEEGHHDIVSILLDRGAQYNVQDEDGNTPCHVACMNNNCEVIELFIHIKADLAVRNKVGYEAFHVAAINDHVQSLALLLKAGVPINAQAPNGNNALHLAAQSKSMCAFAFLLSNGIDVNSQNHDGNSALHICADNGATQLLHCILNSQQSVELSPNNVGDTAKDIAISRGFKDIVALIPDPYNKKKKTRRHKTSNERQTKSAGGSAVSSQSLQDSAISKSFLQHPSEEIPSVTSSSLTSLWVPTTDSGISLPMDKRRSERSSTRSRKKKELTPALDDQCLHRHSSTRSKHKSSKSKMKTYEYAELRSDPRFYSPKLTPKKLIIGSTPQRDHYRLKEDYGALSDESIQYKGCFPKHKSKSKRGTSVREPKSSKTQQSAEEKEKFLQQQLEMQQQLSESKLLIDKQMRRMRKKFEKALRATDERFIEQKRREHNYHAQLRQELECIERSLERGSKKNVEEFTLHIKQELNNLAEKLSKNAGSGENSSEDTRERKKRHRASFVDLEKNISVSLPQNSNRKFEDNTHGLSNLSLTSNAEKENELLRARVQELETIMSQAKLVQNT